MSFGKRIKQYIDYKGVNVSSFEKQSDLKNGAIFRVVKNDTTLNGESIANIGMNWEDLNLNWLMKGEGEMLLEPQILKDPINNYKKEANEIKWYKEALQRADSQIALQREMIDTLKEIIEKQKETARKVGVEL